MKYNGVARDPRSDIQKAQDYSHEELFGMGVYEWKSFNEADIPQYTIRNQDGSSQCGAFASAKALGILNKKKGKSYVNLLPEFIYQKRKNQGVGMYMQDMFDICSKNGSPLDEYLTGDNLNEEQANAYPITDFMTQEALKYASGSYVFIQSNDINEVARVIEEGYTPIILINFDIVEWTAEPYLLSNPKINCRHFVPCIYAGIKDNKKTIVIDDSWGTAFGHNGHRYISEDYWNARVLSVGYMREKIEMSLKPKYVFNKILTYGMLNNPDVKALQDVLKYEGCLDKSVPSTGNYLNLTAQAVLKLQLKNNIASPSELYSLMGKRVGIKTLNYLRKYANA